MSATTLLLALVAVSAQDARPATPAAPRAALRVGTDVVPLAEYRAWLAQTRAEALAPFYADLWLLRRWARESELGVSPADFRAAFEARCDDEIARRLGGDRAAWRAELAAAGRSVAGFTAERAQRLERDSLLATLALRRRAPGAGAGDADEAELAGARAALWNGVDWTVHPELSLPPEPGARARPADELVLTIDGARIERADFAAWLVAERGDLDARAFAEHRAIHVAAGEAGIEVHGVVVAARLDGDVRRELERRHRGDEERWLDDLRERGLTRRAHLRERFVRTHDALLLEGLALVARATPTDDDVRAEFERRYGPDGVRLDGRVIAVEVATPDVPPGSTHEEFERAVEAAVATARAEADALARRARAGEDFAALAREHSDDVETRTDGGRVAGGIVASELPDELAAAVRALEPGGTTDALRVAGSFLVLRVDARVEVVLADEREALALGLRTAQPTTAEVEARRVALLAALDVEVLPTAFE